MTNRLIALLAGREVGTVHYKDARLSFVYNDAWRSDSNATRYRSPCRWLRQSTAMRGSRLSYGDCCPTTTGFLRIGAAFPGFAEECLPVIAHVGEDCAGAVQFVRPERLEAFATDTASKEVKWLTRTTLPNDCAPCARIILRGEALKTQGNSAWLEHSPKRLFFSSASGGEFRLSRSNYAYSQNRPRVNGWSRGE